MTTTPNPFPRGSYEAEYYDSRVAEQEASKIRYDAAMLELPEQATFRRLMTERAVGEIEPDHGHLSIKAREDLRLREVRAAIAAESRGELVEPAPPVELQTHTVWHDAAGNLTLATDGTSWLVRLWGLDHALGPVRRGEIRNGVIRRVHQTIVDAAAQKALADPSGPPSPPDALIFMGGPDGEPIETTVRALHDLEVAQAPKRRFGKTTAGKD